MRPREMLRNVRPVHLVAGAAALAVPGSAAAIAATQAEAQGAIQVKLDRLHLAFGEQVTARGNATSSAAGSTVDLQFAPAGGASWRTLSSAKVRSGGGFTVRAKMRRSGLVRVVSAASSTRSSPSATGGASGAQPSNNDPLSPSSSQPVTVTASFAVAHETIPSYGGSPARLNGHLLPAVAGRRVTVLVRRGGGWRSLISTTTGARGGFQLRLKPRGASAERLRLQFAGDSLNSAVSARAGRLVSFQQSTASWYDDSGGTACGFHAQFGVANRDLPCGTKVTFDYHGKTVMATVDDRGPFVAGRDWDLNQNTASALGFGGVDQIWVSM